MGEDCSEKTCTNNCNAHGTCKNSTCFCDCGFTGKLCQFSNKYNIIIK